MIAAFLVGGLVFLILGGEGLLRGSVALARRLGMSELLIGLTLVGFGTSVPELVTSLQAVSTGEAGVALGNVTGSNIANILLVLGVAALIRPITTHPNALGRDTSVMVLATLIFMALVYFNGFGRITGAALVAALIVYLIVSVILDQKKDSAPAQLHEQEAEIVEGSINPFLALIMAVVGIAAIITGAQWLVKGAVELARVLGVSGTVVGLTIVAIGTSLPELVTAVMASLRGKADVAIGNVIGSNIFNIMGIMGVTAAAIPFNVPYHEFLLGRELGAMGLAVAFLILFALTGSRLSRWEGGVLLLGGAVYLSLLVT